MTDLRKDAWENSYSKGQNILFYPTEELVRFFSRYIRKRTSPTAWKDIATPPVKRALDLGCGTGRHVVFLRENQVDTYGIDLSEIAVAQAKQWLGSDAEEKIVAGDASKLPWKDDFFDLVVSHGVFDSLPMEVAKKIMAETSRCLRSQGYQYLDLIHENSSDAPAGFTGEKSVETEHEYGTVQNYFDWEKVQALVEPAFSMVDARLVTTQIQDGSWRGSRWHLALQKVG